MERVAPREFEAWAIVELFGHARIAGKVTEQQIGGASFIRVDVPELEIRKDGCDLTKAIQVERRAAFTRLFGPAAIYAITPTTEDVARAAAAALGPEPVHIYIPSLRHLLPAGDPDDDPDPEERAR